MKLDAKQWRKCKSAKCIKLDGMECTAQECEHPELGEVKHG